MDSMLSEVVLIHSKTLVSMLVVPYQDSVLDFVSCITLRTEVTFLCIMAIQTDSFN